MPAKTTKKTTAKTATAAKKPVAKKVAPKKTTTKKTVKAVADTPMMYDVSPMQHAHECKCGHTCGCGTDCKCHKHGFAHSVKKLIVVLLLLAIGFVAGASVAKHKMPRGPRVNFDQNGCLVESNIKCPKLLEVLPAMDINQDGCITRDEYHAVKQRMRREIREMDVRIEE